MGDEAKRFGLFMAAVAFAVAVLVSLFAGGPWWLMVPRVLAAALAVVYLRRTWSQWRAAAQQQ